jgi:hypothetical protein
MRSGKIEKPAKRFDSLLPRVWSSRGVLSPEVREMSRKLIAVMLVSWWFLVENSDGGTFQVGPFTSSTACVKVAQSLEAPPSSNGVVGQVCYSSTGQTVAVPPPS